MQKLWDKFLALLIRSTDRSAKCYYTKKRALYL